MKLNIKKLGYLASFDRNKLIGVNKKLEGFLEAAKNMGYTTINYQAQHSKILNFRTIVNILLHDDAKYIIFRSLGWFNIVLLPFILLVRLKGKIIILDLQTPRRASYKEAIVRRNSKIMKLTYTILHYCSGPWAMWPFNKIIQYGNESNYFLLGNKNRTVKMGNGINIESIKLREKKYAWPDTTFKLLGVANLSFHHGYDRIIKAIYQWKNTPNRPYNISFTIAGTGPYLNNLKQLTKELGVESEVNYVGSKNWKELHELYSTNHLAVSSIGLHRLGLTEASVLKAREYCLAGIPFIAAGSDPDFSTNCAFRININNKDTIDDILEIFENFHEKRKQFTDKEIRNYAINHLSFESKLKAIGINPINNDK